MKKNCCDMTMMITMRRIIQYSVVILVVLNIFSVSVVISEQSLITNRAISPINESFDIPEYRAVLVGIGVEQGLPYSEKQLYGFKTTLVNGGNWKINNIRNLTGNKATLYNLLAEFQWLSDHADDNDVSIFYFVGHGSSNGTNECILTYDLPVYDVELNTYLQNISGSIIVIIDACFSGGFIEELQAPNRTILTACNKNSVTYQVKDLESGMFGFFLNLSLAWITRNIETTYISTKLLTWIYGNKISKEYGEDYMIYPQISDGNEKTTRIVNRHAYIKQIYQMIQAMADNDGKNIYWRM
jgi:caspase domain-containing protein